ncbi:MAG: hypothetical protein ACLGH0_14935, partial [Thermoanaerobaculia bacterium]
MKKIALATLLAFAAGAFARDARHHERGYPPIKFHDQKTHGAGAQIFSGAQGTNGVLYFGGLRGVSRYDGAWWQVAELPNHSAVFAVAAGRGPEIAVAGVNEFGWAGPDANGTLTYRSLLPMLPPAQRDLGDVRAVCAADNGFIYVAESAVIAWTGGAPKAIADLRGRTTSPPRCFRAGAHVYVAADTGLERVQSSALADTGFRGRTVDLVLPFDDERIVVAVRGEGLILTNGVTETPFAAEASAWLKEKIATTGTRLPDGRMVIGTRHDGILMLDANGEIDQRLDVTAGLPDAVLASAFADREGSLWLAFHGPIVRVELDPSVSVLDARRGLRGSPKSVARLGDKLYIATSHGVFVSAASDFQPVPGLTSTVWSLLALEDELLLGTADGVYSLRDGGTPQLIDGTRGFVVYHAMQSREEPSRVWISTRRGIGTMQRDGNRWRFERLIAGTPPYSRLMIEHDGAVWAGTIFNGIVRVEGTRVQTFGSGEASVAVVGDRVVVVHERQIKLPSADGKLVPHPTLGNLRGTFFYIAEDAHGNLWTNDTPPRVMRRLADGQYAAEPVALVAVDTPNIQRVL